MSNKRELNVELFFAVEKKGKVCKYISLETRFGGLCNTKHSRSSLRVISNHVFKKPQLLNN